MSNKKKTIDLFAGVGGIRLGFEKAGFETLYSNDFEPQCAHTYNLNFGHDPGLHIEDIKKVSYKDLPKFDILLGGFPCQAFSIAGYREGFSDKKGRGNLFYNVAEILEHKKPKAFLLENVKNLKGHDGGNTFKVITAELERLGYHINYAVLNSMEYGNIPQNRERIYIVGFKDKKKANAFEFPKKQKLTKSFRDFLEKGKVDQKYYYNDKPLYDKLKDFNFRKGTVYQWRRKYVRENKSGVCPTLTANMGRGGHNVPLVLDDYGIRKLTPRECFNLQGFPKNYKLPKIADSHLYHQAGNSVVVPVISRIAKEVEKVFN